MSWRNYSYFVLPRQILTISRFALESVTGGCDLQQNPEGRAGLVCLLAWPWPLSKCFHYLSVQPSVSLTETPVCNQRHHISFGRPTHNLVAAQQYMWQIGSDDLPVPAWPRPGPVPHQPVMQNRRDKGTFLWALGLTRTHAQIHSYKCRVNACRHKDFVLVYS